MAVQKLQRCENPGGRPRAPGLTLTRKSWNKGKCSHSRRGVNTAGVHTVIKVLTHYSHTVHTLAVSHTRASKSHSQLPKPSETSQASANAAIPGFFCTNAQNEPSPHRQCTKARIVTARDCPQPTIGPRASLTANV